MKITFLVNCTWREYFEDFEDFKDDIGERKRVGLELGKGRDVKRMKRAIMGKKDPTRTTG